MRLAASQARIRPPGVDKSKSRAEKHARQKHTCIDRRRAQINWARARARFAARHALSHMRTRLEMRLAASQARTRSPGVEQSTSHGQKLAHAISAVRTGKLISCCARACQPIRCQDLLTSSMNGLRSAQVRANSLDKTARAQDIHREAGVSRWRGSNQHLAADIGEPTAAAPRGRPRSYTTRLKQLWHTRPSNAM